MPFYCLPVSEAKTLALPPVEACVAHRGRMLLIHRLTQADNERAIAEVDVRADSPFARDDGIPAWIGLEYMAQTVAAWAGARALRLGAHPKLGFLLGTRRFESTVQIFPRGKVLRVDVHCEMMADNGLGQFDCQIEMDETVVCRARISVFEPDNVAQVLGDGILS
jgi:predicted hotdog family 3-hydroxylacyl-ACP dehydratase